MPSLPPCSFFRHPHPSGALKRRSAAQHRSTAVSSPVIWAEGKVNLHNSEKILHKPQIALLDLGLRPGGKGALVMTGGPGGDGADGSCRRAEGALWIMWLAAAVTISLLSPLIPAIPAICGEEGKGEPFPSRNSSSPGTAVESGSSEMRFCRLSVFIHFPQSWPVFLVSPLRRRQDSISAIHSTVKPGFC